MNEGERQVAPTIDGIRRDHVARYEFARRINIERGYGRVIDIACGVGYGSAIMAEHAQKVSALDANSDAIEYARKHYARENINYRQCDANFPYVFGEHDVAVCFETIEHIEDPRELLRSLRKNAKALIASVPNEDEYPFANHQYHFRHYTRDQFEALLKETGWRVTSWYGQADDESDVTAGANGRTIIAICEHRQPNQVVDLSPAEFGAVPEHVAILGLGPSVSSYLELVKRFGGRRKFCDEVWTINALGNVFDCDRVFHMDDIRIQEIRAKAKPESNIATMVDWLKDCQVPVYTSRPHPEYPALTPYPLEFVVRETGYSYANSTAAHAVALAVAIGVKKMTIFGMDFTYAKSHDAEKGRACVEFWLGMAAAKGIKISIPQSSSLMDGCEPERNRLYGYDTLDVNIGRDEEGKQVIKFTEREEPLPTAEEIERRYDHTAHPNPLVKQ